MIHIDSYRIGYQWWWHFLARYRLVRGRLSGKMSLDDLSWRRILRWRRKGGFSPTQDRWHRCWQAEWDGCERAVRAWTEVGVRRKAMRAIDERTQIGDGVPRDVNSWEEAS